MRGSEEGDVRFPRGWRKVLAGGAETGVNDPADSGEEEEEDEKEEEEAC